jgi:hypothetical protein
MASKHLKHKAICLITACLDSLEIGYKLGTGETPDMLVRRARGGLGLMVKVVLADSMGLHRRGRELQVLAPEITSQHRGTADAAFGAITDAAGYGSLSAINRGAEAPIPPGRKTNRPYGDDPDRVIFRERVFRLVANPTHQVYKQMDGVIMTCCRFFFQKNENLCLQLAFDLLDLKTYAQVWTANFWSTDRVLNPKKDENERLLYTYLRQRFAEMYTQMRDARSRNTVADKQSILIGLGIEHILDSDGFSDRQRDGSYEMKAVRYDEPVIDEEAEANMEAWQKSHTILDTSTEKKRRTSAATLLAKNLAALPHETLLRTLTDAAESRFLCPDTRKEAQRQLDLHVKKCSACTALARPDDPANEQVVVALDVGDDAAEAEAGSLLETA